MVSKSLKDTLFVCAIIIVFTVWGASQLNWNSIPIVPDYHHELNTIE